ncbi:MAG: hypothetical protein JGK31_00620 [Microcoleus sp. PH2017_30_WIL_O_A]|nr:hypothetical protein [Microcoleus sp. PH2017_30_WIL_O_A]
MASAQRYFVGQLLVKISLCDLAYRSIAQKLCKYLYTQNYFFVNTGRSRNFAIGLRNPTSSIGFICVKHPDDSA